MPTAAQRPRPVAVRYNGDTAGPRSLLLPGREAAFLDLDFSSLPRPECVTRLLTITGASGSQGEGDEVSPWSLSVATRLKRLLQIVAETTGLSALSLRERCRHAPCGQILEIDLPLADLDALHDESADGELLHFPNGDSRPLTFRRPTGEDLLRWLEPAPGREPNAVDVLRSLLVADETIPGAPELPPPEICAAAFAEFDALVGFRFTARCPHCGREGDQAVDLEILALERLTALQRQLYRENHQLALAYGWSEADILQVPRRRRLRYLALLEATA